MKRDPRPLLWSLLCGALAVLLAAEGLRVAWAVPLLGPHHYPAQTGTGTANRIILAGDLLDPAALGAPDALALEMIGDVVATGTLDHAGHTLCWGVCEITPPARSPELKIRCESRVRINGDWVLPAGFALDIRACSQLIVAGTLTAPQGGLAMDITGTPPALPVVLVSATELSGTFTAGTLPPGTQLVATPTQLILEATP